MTSQDLIDQVKSSLQRLNVQRTSLEQEGDAIVSELKDDSRGEPMGIDTPLVDSEGYPRGDIDLYRARTLRGRLQVLRTDHRQLMKSIEETLRQLAVLQNPNKLQQEKAELEARQKPKPKPKYDAKTGKWVVMNWDGTVAGVPGGEGRSFRDLSTRDQSTTAAVTHPAPVVVPSRPFARVNSVAPQSPSLEAGLLENDLILAFGAANISDSMDPMKQVGELVVGAAAKKQAIPVHVRRNNKVVKLELRPQPWSGRGLLGCHILPYRE